jgi:uncharacterized NAD(P)/FAD-binding protein YdhS
MAAAQRSIAVIGAGFSGLMCAIHLLEKSPGDGPRVYLIEQSDSFGLGAAYSTDSGRHALNTRAANMSVFPDKPSHFLEWLEAQPGAYGVSATAFITRRTYGDYLQSLLRDIACREHAAGRLYLVPDETIALEKAEGGYALSLKVGKVLHIDAAILATGNAPPHPPPVPDSAFFDSPRYIDEPWSRSAFDAIGTDDSVLMIGSGLTMVDIALLLKSRGHNGPLIALSRRGLLPRPHTAAPPARPAIALPRLPGELSQALRTVRALMREAEANGGTWRQVMDGLRPLNSLYWQGLSLEAKRRFLRHLRPWWDVHRHRLAPQAAARIEIMMRDGELTVCRGRLARFALEEWDGFPVTVTWRSPGNRGVTERGVHHVVNCMGPGGDPTRSNSPLIQHLLAGGLARSHVLRVGFDVDADGRLIDRGRHRRHPALCARPADARLLLGIHSRSRHPRICLPACGYRPGQP